MKKHKWIIIDFFVLLTIFFFSIALVVLGKWSWQWIAIFFILNYIFNIIFVIFSVVNEDPVMEKFSWIIFVICVPWIGIIFYMLFKVRRTKQLSMEEMHERTKEFLINQYVHDDSKNNQFISWQSQLVKRNFYKTNLEIFKHGYEAYDVLLKDIEKAKKYIHIEMYILKKSEIYERLKHILFKKVEEGVEVKIIFDKFGSWKVPIDEFKYLKSKGIELYFYNIPFYPYVRNTDNKRLHRKFFIIDGEVVHFGGLNVSDEYCSFSTKYGYWIDLNCRATGKIINDYQSCFLIDWYQVSKKKLDYQKYVSKNNQVKSNADILCFEEGPNVKTTYLEDSIIHWINSSNKSIKLATPYFIPTISLYKAINNALRRGVKVDLYIPGKPDKKFTYKATLFYANKIAKNGANIHITKNTFLHSKFGIFDDQYSYIGTNNLDMRSLFSNYEIINLIYGKDAIDNLNEIIEFYQNLSIEKEYKKINPIKKFGNEFIFRLLSPLM